MYSEEDILLLIKFIVKEFAHIVLKWTKKPTINSSFFGLNCLSNQSNMNSMLLSALLAKETSNLQNQEMMQSQLMQQVNSILLSDMLEQNRNNSGDTSPIDRSKNVSVTSFPPTTIAHNEPVIQEQDVQMKFESRPCAEFKDEVETIQSSEDKTDRNRSSSDDPSVVTVKRIELNQAYSLLESNSVLKSLIKNFSNTSN